MENAVLYAATNESQCRDAKQILDEYMHLIQWKPNVGDRIMDIGCGPGDVTVQILLPRIPKSISELVATDRSSNMLQYARDHYKHPKVQYDVLDISVKKLPKKYRANYDHVFSLYCLHWLQDQRQAMENIFNLLQPGGDVLLMYLANHPVYDVFLKLSQQKFWQSYIQNVRQYVSPHHGMLDVEGTMHQIIQDVGFKNITCHCRRSVYVYDNVDKYTDAMTAIHPFNNQLSDDMKEIYLLEYVSALKNQVYENAFIDSATPKVYIPYSLIIINGTKPFNPMHIHT